jgi:fucose 4-O-acetylase-like acetyltransferase
MRIQSIDVARGLCIALVVWGHNHQFGDTHANHVLGMIRMPLMFFIAGSFMSNRQSWATLLNTKAHALLKPFLVMALIQAPVRMALGQTTLESLIVGLVAGGGHFLPWIFSLWYLPHLWWVFILGYAIITYGGLDRLSQNSKIIVLAACVILGNLVLEWAQAWGALPFQAQALPRDLALFLLGYACKTWLGAWTLSWQRLALPPITMASSYWLLTHVYANASPEIHAAWTTLTCFAGMALMMSIANGLSQFRAIRQILSECGRESIFILLFHFPLQNASTTVWAKLLPSEPWCVATLSWLCAVGLSIAAARLMRMNRWSASLWLPMAQAKCTGRAPLAVPVTAGSGTAKPATARLDHLEPGLASASPYVKR